MDAKPLPYRTKGFTLAEVLVAIVLMGIVIMAVASVDITSRRFFGTSSKETWIQDEGKIAMEHIVKNLQLGVGNMSIAGGVGDDPYNIVIGTNSYQSTRGFYILDASGNLAADGNRIQIKIDTDEDGRFESGEQIAEYEYWEDDPGPPERHDYIRYYPDATDRNTFEPLADGIVEFALFTMGGLDNQVEVIITVLRDPDEDPSLDNPATTLTSDIILRAMSTN